VDGDDVPDVDASDAHPDPMGHPAAVAKHLVAEAIEEISMALARQPRDPDYAVPPHDPKGAPMSLDPSVFSRASGFALALLLSGCGGSDGGPQGTGAAEAKSSGVFCLAPGAGPGELSVDQLSCVTSKPLAFCPPGTGDATTCAAGSTASSDSTCTMVDPGCGGGALVACCPGVSIDTPQVASCLEYDPAITGPAQLGTNSQCYSEKVGDKFYWCCT
jgi:hypothetical protein